MTTDQAMAPLPALRLSLWQTWRLMMATYPIEHVQTGMGLWSVLWGLAVPLTGAFALSPAAYAWMAVLPAWAWGAAFVAKGAWQVVTGLALARGRLTLSADDPARAALLARCVPAARCAFALSAAVAVGFLLSLGPANLYVLWYVFQAAVNGWILRRAAHDRH